MTADTPPCPECGHPGHAPDECPWRDRNESFRRLIDAQPVMAMCPTCGWLHAPGVACVDREPNHSPR